MSYRSSTISGSMTHGHRAGDAAAGTLLRPFADRFPTGGLPVSGPAARRRANGLPEPTTMASPNRARVERCLDLLRCGLAPFIERELDEAVEAGCVDAEVLRSVAPQPWQADAPLRQWDAAALLRAMWELRNSVFRSVLGPTERSLVQELRTHGDDWTRQEPFSDGDTCRALDSAARLLSAVSAPGTSDLEAMKADLRQQRFEEERPGGEKRAISAPPREPNANGKPRPHPAPRPPTPPLPDPGRPGFPGDARQPMNAGGPDLRPLPAVRRQSTPPLTGPGNGFEFLKPVLAAIGDGVSHSHLVLHLQTVRPQWKPQRAEHYLERIRKGLRVIEQRVATIRLTASGRALRQTGNPDALREWMLTGLLGFDHLLVWMAAAPRPKPWLLDELRHVNRRWTTDDYPRSLVNWTLWLNLSEETHAGFTLTERGKAWRSLIHWNPEPLN